MPSSVCSNRSQEPWKIVIVYLVYTNWSNVAHREHSISPARILNSHQPVPIYFAVGICNCIGRASESLMRPAVKHHHRSSRALTQDAPTLRDLLIYEIARPGMFIWRRGCRTRPVLPIYRLTFFNFLRRIATFLLFFLFSSSLFSFFLFSSASLFHPFLFYSRVSPASSSFFFVRLFALLRSFAAIFRWSKQQLTVSQRQGGKARWTVRPMVKSVLASPSKLTYAWSLKRLIRRFVTGIRWRFNENSCLFDKLFGNMLEYLI